MDERYSPQPSTSEVKEILVDSDEAEDFEDEEAAVPAVAAPSSVLQAVPKAKIKRQKRPPDPTDPVVIAAAAAAAKAEAEAEAAERREEGSKMTSLENLKYYTSLFLGTVCIVNVFAFLFLVPFVLDPAISTLRHRFVDSPVTCKVTNVSVRQGKSQCLWSSCREGCTSDMYQCYQVRVQYIDQHYKNDTFVQDFHSADWKNLSRFDILDAEVLSYNCLYSSTNVSPTIFEALVEISLISQGARNAK